MARIDAVDFFYLSMPRIEDVGDGSQDALVVRVAAGAEVGWGECEAAPLPSIASLVCPMSHSACHPVRDSVLGERLDDVGDIARIADRVRARSLDLLQAAHTLSGVEMALWDLLGRRLSAPAWALLGYTRSEPRTPYASVLFGDDAQATLEKARAIRAAGFRAAKFGWGPTARCWSTPEPSGSTTQPPPKPACPPSRRSARSGSRSRSSRARSPPTPRSRPSAGG